MEYNEIIQNKKLSSYSELTESVINNYSKGMKKNTQNQSKDTQKYLYEY